MRFPNPFGKSKATEKLSARGIEFLGEQDGPSEKLLKEKLSSIFIEHEFIVAAYLLRVRYEKPEMKSVALCIISTRGAVKALVEAVHDLFRKEFARGAHLDIMFPTDKQRLQIDAVCKPFYRRGPLT